MCFFISRFQRKTKQQREREGEWASKGGYKGSGCLPYLFLWMRSFNTGNQALTMYTGTMACLSGHCRGACKNVNIPQEGTNTRQAVSPWQNWLSAARRKQPYSGGTNGCPEPRQALDEPPVLKTTVNDPSTRTFHTCILHWLCHISPEAGKTIKGIRSSSESKANWPGFPMKTK